MKQTKGVRAFNVFNIALLTVISLAALLPFIHIIAKSFSNEVAVLTREVILWPVGFNLYSYQYVLNNNQFLVSLGNSLFITSAGTFISIMLTVFAAYPLTKKNMPFNSLISLLYIITMFFGGGMIPTYLLYKQLGLYDNIWVLILPGAITPFNMILMRNFFESISPSVEESARIDGASSLNILFKIILPLSKAAIATIGLFYAVSFWNSFFGAMLYTSKSSIMPLQLYLRNLILNLQGSNLDLDWEAATHVVLESIRAATIIAAMVPILIVYPFLQKHFVKGVMIGAVKE